MLGRIIQYLISVKFAAFLLILFAAVIGYATFIENDFGRDTAKALVYNKFWFEFIMIMLCINLVYNLKRYKLFRKEKLSILLFHLSFIVILLGAGVTRYFGYEGIMHIREGESSNIIISDQTYLQINVNDKKMQYTYDMPLSLSAITNNTFTKPIKFLENKIEIKYEDFLVNVRDTFIEDPNSTSKTKALHIIVPGENGMKSEFLKDKEQRKIKDVIYTYNNKLGDAINFFDEENKIKCIAPFDISSMKMLDQSKDTHNRNEKFTINQRTLYSNNNLNFVLKEIIDNGINKYYSNSTYMKDGKSNLLRLKVKSNGQEKDIELIGGKGRISEPTRFTLGNLNFSLSYGSKQILTPFNIFLRDFQLDRYPGSSSPSSFAAEVTVVDKDVDKDYRIYMNNVLDYRGYRFFQSSYDKDEMGTVLSVNYDLAGTIITYLGYLLLALGMVSVFFTRQSRFKFLTKKLSKANLFLLPFLIPLLSFSSEKEISYIDKEHSKKFDRLLVQDQGGRIKPMNTLCSEYLRKISKKNSLENLNSTQVILSMMVNPHEWASKDIIKVKHEQIKQVVGASSSRTSFKSFFEKDGSYKLKTLVEQAYEKEPINRGKLEKDIISVDERVNICFILFNGDLMRIFPLRGDPNNTWYNSKQHQLFSGKDSLFVSNILKLYFSSINSSYESKNWNEPDSLLNYIIKFQNMYASSDIMPSNLKINTEIWYNNLDIFGKLYKFYIVIGLLMLISLFYEIFNNNKSVKKVIKFFKYLIFSGFIFHTIGLAFRWIASGHAPWSNGYESMIYTAWATLLSGIIFSKKSNFTLSATAIVGSLILMFASMNWMDPTITNLVPVLNSYWLMIHVAIIVASYGFLFLGAILGLMCLWIIVFTNNENKKKLKSIINSLTNINERGITVGVFMLTIGTFLGGVWANESWGRYWGWDPKETWALVSILVYAFVLHMRLIPAISSKYSFNLASLVAIWSILMTYFGVNYYLSGLHSYAAGDPMPIPNFVYYFLFVTIVTAILSRIKFKKYYI